MNIIFFGTSEFACEALSAIHISNHKINAVITNPDKPRGRGKKLQESPISKLSKNLGYRIIKPLNLNDSKFINNITFENVELFVVVEFKILPEVVLEIPPNGIVNLHASILPQYRGAAPIQYALMNGDEKTGVSTFFINQYVDTGSIIDQKECTISQQDDFGSLYKKLAIIGSNLLVKSIDKIERNEVVLQEQCKKNITYAPKITKKDCKINWNLKSSIIFNLIRSISPSPGAFTYFRNKKIFIYKAKLVDKKTINNDYGTLYVENSNIYISTKDKMLQVLKLKVEGKNIITDIEFINGYRLKRGDKFE